MMSRNEVIFETIAKAMNAGGSAIVSAYDAGAAAFNCTMSALSPGERSKLRDRIKVLEKKIQALYVAIGKETSKYEDPAAALESESVLATLADIKEYNNEIEQMKQRIAEIDKTKTEQESVGVAKFISHSISGFMPGEKASLERKIHGNEKKIQELYCDFAKETAKQADPSAAVVSEPVISIIAKINELKAENESLKLGITGSSGTKTDKPQRAEKKPQPAEKKPQPESSGVTKFFMRAISDSISGYLPSQNQRTVETSDENKSEEAESKEQIPNSEEVSSATVSGAVIPDDNSEVSDSASSEQSASAVIGYARTKPCLISTPDLQPPTREDIETVTRVLQADAAQEELPTADVEVTGGTEEAATTLEVEPESSPDTVIEESPADTADSEEAVVEEAAPVEPAGEETPSDKPVIEETLSVEPVTEETLAEEPITEETPSDEPVAEETLSVEPVAEENLPVESAAEETLTLEPATEETLAEESITEETPLDEPVSVETLPVEPVAEENLLVEPVAEEFILVTPAVPEGEFESIRTRSHSTSFAASLENPVVIQTTDHKPEAVFVDESWPVFHTRVRQAVTTDAVESIDTAEISGEGESDTQKEKRNGKKWVAPQKHFDIKKRR